MRTQLPNRILEEISSKRGVMGKVTAREVARAAGVSASTVDRVLNNRGGVDKAKEAAVLEAARRLRLDRALDLRAARTLRVAAFIQAPDNPFHAALQAAIEAENHGPNPYNIQTRIHHIAPRLTAAQIARVGEVAARHDAAILCIAHDDRLAVGLAGLVAAGRPVVTLATEIRCPGALYVGPDNRASGRVAGDLVGRLLGGAGGEIMVIAGHLSMLGHAERVAGFDEVLAARYPACRVVAQVESHDQADLAADLTWRELKRRPGLCAIYNAAVGASAVAQALKGHGRTGDVVLVGHELTADSRPLLASGAIDALIDQDPALEIQTAIAAIARRYGRALDEAAPPFTPLRIVMRENC